MGPQDCVPGESKGANPNYDDRTSRRTSSVLKARAGGLTIDVVPGRPASTSNFCPQAAAVTIANAKEMRSMMPQIISEFADLSPWIK
jgi:hypothetical protein